MPYIFRIQMNFYDRFLKKNLSEVTCILQNSGHESILDHLEETDDGFTKQDRHVYELSN